MAGENTQGVRHNQVVNGFHSDCSSPAERRGCDGVPPHLQARAAPKPGTFDVSVQDEERVMSSGILSELNAGVKNGSVVLLDARNANVSVSCSRHPFRAPLLRCQ